MSLLYFELIARAERNARWPELVGPMPPQGTDAIAQNYMPPPDTNVPMTWREMAAQLHKVSVPVADPCRSLPFDPDEYPFR